MSLSNINFSCEKEVKFLQSKHFFTVIVELFQEKVMQSVGILAFCSRNQLMLDKLNSKALVTSEY